MKGTNGRFTYQEMQRFTEIFECEIRFVKKNGIKRYQISTKKTPMIVVAEFKGDTIKGFRLELIA